MKKYILLVLLVASAAYADVAYQQKVPNESENDIVTSQEYVNDRVGRSQDLIQPLPLGTTVDKIVTPPATVGGAPGARDIVTDLATGASDGIPTSGTVYTATNAKNDNIRAFNNQNVVTYTGTNTVGAAGLPGRGIVTSTPIYSREMNTYENGLVRASTLNEAVQYAIDHELTRNDSDPQGTLWDVTALTAPAPLPVTANLPPTIETFDMSKVCYKPIVPSETKPGGRGYCTESRWGPDTATPNEYSHAGDWGVVFNHETGISADGVTCTGANSQYCNKEIRGISACISTPGNVVMGGSVPSSLWATLDAAYNAHKNGESLASDAKYCYCKLTAPAVTGPNGTASRWVYYNGVSATRCATECTKWCLILTRARYNFAMFGAYDE
ncbi:MAG: hypothetical protein J6T57_00775 [Alphaproteobacteria bacterium]|nr:hypothetical protein [Alphaproteobacteria bacterium]